MLSISTSLKILSCVKELNRLTIYLLLRNEFLQLILIALNSASFETVPTSNMRGNGYFHH